MDCYEYERRFELAKDLIISYCRKTIADNYDGHFTIWLDVDADREFSQGYQNIFNARFEEYMTDELRVQLSVAGKNLIYAISTLVSIKKIKSEELMHFISKMVSKQLDGISHDCDTYSWIKDEGDS